MSTNLFYHFGQTEEFEMKATTLFGLEEVLQQELQKLGGKKVEAFKRGVSFVGDLGFLYKANLCVRTALKIIVPIARFTAHNEQALYDGMKQLPWEKFLEKDDSLMVEAVANSEQFTHTLFIAQKTKDAICDRFREKTGQRPDVDLIHPILKIYVHIYKNEVTVNIDSSGELLYKRGYRSDTNKAPINEVLASGLIALSGWQPHLQLIDGMCGSGTIPIEAALRANNVPPGYFRKEFGFMKWKNFDEQLFETIYESSIARIKDEKLDIWANEIEATTLKKAQSNFKNAKLDDVIKTTNESFFDIKPERRGGVIILNPPYGERLSDQEVSSLYKEIGNKFKKDFGGYTGWIITSSLEGFKNIGLRPSRKIALFNGSLECRFLKFELYEGSKRQKFQEKKE
jgi:putative N6-adenine-specific DNA methylase